MKYIIIEGESDPRLLLNTMSDWIEYRELVIKNNNDMITTVMRSDVEPNKYDHIKQPETYGCGWYGAVTRSKITGCNPLLEMGAISDRVHAGIGKCMAEGEEIIINKFGGWDIYKGQVYKELEDFKIKHWDFIEGNTNQLALENDPKPDPYYKKIGYEGSIVTGLRSIPEDELFKIMLNHKNKHGDAELFVYTTGTDEEQLMNYMKIAVEDALIQNFTFVLSVQPSKKLNDFFGFVARKSCVNRLDVFDLYHHKRSKYLGV